MQMDEALARRLPPLRDALEHCLPLLRARRLPVSEPGPRHGLNKLGVEGCEAAGCSTYVNTICVLRDNGSCREPPQSPCGTHCRTGTRTLYTNRLPAMLPSPARASAVFSFFHITGPCGSPSATRRGIELYVESPVKPSREKAVCGEAAGVGVSLRHDQELCRHLPGEQLLSKDFKSHRIGLRRGHIFRPE